MNADHMPLSKRILSIDILRGLVMIIMALDHTRDFFHISAMTGDPLNPETTTGMLFFTRWITHFCAPTFVFLSGLSAYLSAQNKTPAKACSFLLKRGLWLIVIEIALITLGLTFNPFYNLIILQVIWAIGFSMIFLALFSRISYKTVLIIGLILVFGHNLFDLFPAPADSNGGLILKIFFTASGTILPVSSTHLVGVFYAILPWTGVMFVGYGVGAWYKKGYAADRRKRNLLIVGLLTIFVFISLRLINIYGDPAPRKEYHDFFKNLLAFFNVSKYPPSLQYTAMTLGPAILFLAFTENLNNWFTRITSVYGAVPFFYYILHFYLLHTLLVIVFFATGYTSKEIVQIPFWFRPATFGFGLPIVYLIWFCVVAALYLPCRWFKRYKENHKQWWLRYI
nr:heparan-alpha-glucosaminide N-acetyltransferase domain-containing protein [uncultured Pedobacter sp.]